MSSQTCLLDGTLKIALDYTHKTKRKLEFSKIQNTYRAYEFSQSIFNFQISKSNFSLSVSLLVRNPYPALHPNRIQLSSSKMSHLDINKRKTVLDPFKNEQPDIEQPSQTDKESPFPEPNRRDKAPGRIGVGELDDQHPDQRDAPHEAGASPTSPSASESKDEDESCKPPSLLSLSQFESVSFTGSIFPERWNNERSASKDKRQIAKPPSLPSLSCFGTESFTGTIYRKCRNQQTALSRSRSSEMLPSALAESTTPSQVCPHHLNAKYNLYKDWTAMQFVAEGDRLDYISSN